jgi:hypothetical protein
VSVDTLTQTFEDRQQEIDAYLDLLAALERQIREGPPKIGGATITAQQQKILYSSVYLQLYNLVEATATWCIDTVAAAAANGGRWRPGDLSPDLRREWVRVTAHTHTTLNEEKRLASAVEFCDRLIQALPLSKWSLEKGGGGNWDDQELEAMTARIGFQLRVSQPVYTGIKRKMRENMGALALVKYLRNRLAHGTLSFAECGDGVTVAELKDIKDRVACYLREVVQAFRAYIDGYEFLDPARRPAVGGQP